MTTLLGKFIFAIALFSLGGFHQLAVADEAEIAARSRFVLELMNPGSIDREHPKFKTYDVLGLTATKGCGGKADTDYMAKVLDLGEYLPNGLVRPEIPGSTVQAPKSFRIPMKSRT